MNSIETTDERLLASEYLKQQGGHDAYNKWDRDHCRRVTELFDVKLTDLEREKLESELGNPNVKEHGWFDVRSTGSTY